MRIEAPAKLNLRLRVLGRRADEFHAIETLFLRLRLADTLTLEPGGEGIRLRVGSEPDTEAGSAAPAPDGEGNLCWRAARLLYDELGRPPSVEIGLEKRIPVAAGLGGGSSDAAAVLVELNRALGAPLDRTALLRLAGRLGSDVPFFAAETACALAWDRGQRLLPLAPPPARPVLVVVPGFGVSAADAYRWWGEDGGSAAPAGLLPPPARLAAWEVLEELAVNDLESSVERRHPQLAELREALRAAGAAVAMLCGSGSCVAGVFRTEGERDAARAALTTGPATRGWKLVSTCTEGPPGS